METKVKLWPHLPPVSIGLFQENKPLALSDADLPSVIPPVVVVILGLQDHRAAGDPANNPSGGFCGSCSRRLVPNRAPPGPWEHDFKEPSSSSCAGSGLMGGTGDKGGVSRGRVRPVPGWCHDLHEEDKRIAVRDPWQCSQRRVHFRHVPRWLLFPLTDMNEAKPSL